MIDFTVTPDGGTPYTVKATSRDLFAWEKTDPKHQRNMITLARTASMVQAVPLAYLTSVRQGKFQGTEDEFARTCDVSFEFEETDDAVDPTPMKATDDTSSFWPSTPE